MTPAGHLACAVLGEISLSRQSGGMRFVYLGLACAVAGACQRKPSETKAAEPPPAPTAAAPQVADGAWRATPLGRDLDRICNVIERSGAAALPEGEQVMATLEWLPANIESESGREFLASIAQLEGDAKADALEAGARRVGLSDCPTAGLWRGR